MPMPAVFNMLKIVVTNYKLAQIMWDVTDGIHGCVKGVVTAPGSLTTGNLTTAYTVIHHSLMLAVL